MIWLVLGGLIGLYLGGCFVMAKGYVSPVRLNAGERLAGVREVAFETDGYEIPAWRGGEGDDVFLLVHGYGGRQGYWNELATELMPHGEVVAIATMGQTVSPVGEVGFGAGEAGEVLAVARALRAEGKRVHVVGVSMGGAAAWLAAGEEPELFSSVTTEAAFARLDWGSDDFLSVSVPGGARFFRPIVLLAEKKKGVNGAEIRPVDAAKKYEGPALILHSRGDGMFGERHAEALANAAGVEITWFEGWKHAEIFQNEARKVGEMIREVGGVE
ncbi:hypothetical protein CCB80_01440 [Armatimonadetes bacterium Uphvl-Ar1]|nr:hypothetical protein CCB80_01440 [Armatimonadetes bacterium Uphvl-Ar1]